MKKENREVMLSMEDLRACSDKELNTIINESQQAILGIRTEGQFCPIEKPHLLKAHKKLIARCKTILKGN